MSSVLLSLLRSLQFMARSRASLHLEIIALRTPGGRRASIETPRLGLTSADRVLCAWLSQAWSGWRSAVHIVKTETVSMAPARLSPVLEVEEAATGSATAAGTAAGRAAKGVAAVGCLLSVGELVPVSSVAIYRSAESRLVKKGARDHGRMHVGVQALRSPIAS